MKKPKIALKDKIVQRLVAQPECLSMSEFAQISALYLPMYCLVGLILDESKVSLKYNAAGIAIGLAEGELPPSASWIKYELSLSKQVLGAKSVAPAAKARELFAADHGDAAAKALLFYAPDWGLEPSQFDQITPEHVIGMLQLINVEVGVAA